MEHVFCRRCGSSLTKKETSLECDKGHRLFPAAAPSTGVLFLRKDKVILSRRGIEPHKGALDAIGGFVDIGENFEQAMIREITEETGLEESDYSDLKYFCNATAQYEYQGENIPVLSVFYIANLSEEARPVAKDDISALEEIPIQNIDIEDIGNEDVKIAMKKLMEEFTKNE